MFQNRFIQLCHVEHVKWFNNLTPQGAVEDHKFIVLKVEKVGESTIDLEDILWVDYIFNFLGSETHLIY